MAKRGNGNRNSERIWRNYEIVDIETGEIVKQINNKDYITINYEINEKSEKYVERGYLKVRKIITTRRFVKELLNRLENLIIKREKTTQAWINEEPLSKLSIELTEDLVHLTEEIMAIKLILTKI